MSYINDKNKELNLLSLYCGNKIQNKYNNPHGCLMQKEMLVKQMKFQNFDKYYHDLSNKTSLNINDKNFSYKYTYERFNGHLVVNNFVEDFYGFKGYLYEHFFSNCGMSAITSLLTSMICYNNIKIDLMYSETYFETIKLISNLTKNLVYQKRALYIDSIANDFNFDISEAIINQYDFIVIDTTCFLSYKFHEFINKIIQKYCKPCLLVRSHTKLDMGGTEYSHLGSVTFLFNEQIETKLLKKIIEDCKHIIGVIGACLPPEKFPQFMIDENFIVLNKKRVKRIESNTEYMASIFKENGIDLKVPNHKQFCLYNFSNPHLEIFEMKEKIVDFCKEYSKLGIYHAVSFGFDFIAIDGYENFNDKKFKIRISLCDFPISLIKDISYRIIELINLLESYGDI